MMTRRSSLLPAGLAVLLSVSACQCGDSVPVTVPPDRSSSSVSVDRAEGVLADGKDSVTVQVRLTGGDGKPIRGAEVALTVSGSDNVLGALAPTNDAGVSTTTLATTRAERKELSASVKVNGELVALEQHPAIQFVHGPAAKLAFTLPPSEARAGANLGPSVQVAVQDAQGNAVGESSADITLQLDANPAEGTLGGTTRRAASAGLASFEDLRINRASPGYSLRASSEGLDSAVSEPFAITVGAPARLAFSVEPSQAVAGTALSPALQVAVEDAEGNRIADSTVPITVALAENPGEASLHGTATVAAVGGVATFSDLSLDKVAEGYRLAVTSSGLAGATSAAFTILAGEPDAATTTLGALPSSVVADGNSVSVLTLVVRDAYGNPVPNAAVTLGASGSSNALSATTGTTDASGVFTAAFTSTKAEVKTVTATVDSLTLTTRVTFTPGQPSAAHSQVSLGPTSVVANGSSTITVTVLDANNNAVPGATVALTASGSVNTFSPSASGATNGSGLFTATLASPKVETKTVTARVADTFDLTGTVTFVPGPPDAQQSSIAASPSSVPSDGATASQITVTLRDAFGNPVPGRTVSLSASGGSPTFTQPSAVTDSAGVTSGSVKSSTAGTTSLTATVNPDGVVLATQATVTFENTYYVNAATGLDTNPGTQALPWKTLTKAITTAPAGTAYIYAAPGTYSAGETFPITPRANQHLIGDVANKGNGSTPTRISGGAAYNCGGGDLPNSGYFVAVGMKSASNNASLSGFSITNPNGGETVWICNATVTLANNTLFGPSDIGLIVGFGANVTLTANDVRDSVWNALFYDAGTRVKARGNTFTSATQHAIVLGYTSSFTGSGIDLGTAEDPGNNTLLGNATGVGLNFFRPTGSVVQAAGNTWKASVQGANGLGKYAPQLITSGVAATAGNNYSVQVSTGGGLQL